MGLNELATSLAAGRITLAQMEIATTGLQAQLEEVERVLAVEMDTEEDTRLLISDNVRRFREMTTAERRQILTRSARIRLFPKGRGRRNVSAKHQVEMDLVTYWKDGTERIIPALAERPSDLADVNTEPQQRNRARGEKAGRLR